MKKVIYSIAILSAILAAEGCKETPKESPVLTQEVRFTKEGEGTLIKVKSDSVLAHLELEIAEGEYETQTGLMYRKSMQDNRGMLFIFPDETRRSFYMKNTEFGLDIIYLNANNEVVSIQKNAQPLDQTSLPSEAPAKYVLEVNAGLTDRWNLEAGDRLNWTRD